MKGAHSMTNWPQEFARVVSCNRCTTDTSSRLLRDGRENVPQPGFVGQRYHSTRLVLIGQNPGIRRHQTEARDKGHMAALRTLRDQPNGESFTALSSVLREVMKLWPVYTRHFPLRKLGLELDQVAYFNVVRCRTSKNALPGSGLVSNCIDAHLKHWLELLKPRVVIFLGTWAFRHAGHIVRELQIPCHYINRDRSLDRRARATNRTRVLTLVQGVIGNAR